MAEKITEQTSLVVLDKSVGRLLPYGTAAARNIDTTLTAVKHSYTDERVIYVMVG